jgi:threonylcarbamoyladenosine tRNA methylthiotransferase MtaB
MRFLITTLGCKVNQSESEAMAQALRDQGWTEVRATETADVCIVNTCTVTQKASMQSRQTIRKLQRRFGRARIVVTGCYAQTAPAEIEAIGGVDFIFGHSYKSDIPRLIVRHFGDRPADPARFHDDIRRQHTFALPPAPAVGARTRPFLKIQDGCNRFCTYCIVPYARGPSRSLPRAQVMAQLHHLAQMEHREVVLTGIHLGTYGLDATPPDSLTDLLQAIEDEGPAIRIRLSSLEPDELDENLIAMMARSRKLCPHLHLPLQSGDDAILARMKRPYDRAQFERIVYAVQAQMPSAAIGADVLVGFPGESDQAFGRTCDLVDALPLSYLHVFPFSPRPGTPAFHFDHRVPDHVIKERTAVIRRIGREKKRVFMARHIGSTCEILVETRRDRASGLLKGIAANYLTVLLEGDDRLMNRCIAVEIQSVHSEGRLLARLPREPMAARLP